MQYHRIIMYDKATKQIENIECRSLTAYRIEEFEDFNPGRQAYYTDMGDGIGGINRDYRIEIDGAGQASFVHNPRTRQILRMMVDTEDMRVVAGESVLIKVMKYILKGDELTPAKEGNERIKLSCSRGYLSALEIDLKDGEAEIIWTSVKETIPVKIIASEITLGTASVDIELIP